MTDMGVFTWAIGVWLVEENVPPQASQASMVRGSPCLMVEVLWALMSLHPQSVQRMCVNVMLVLCSKGCPAREDHDFLRW